MSAGGMTVQDRHGAAGFVMGSGPARLSNAGRALTFYETCRKLLQASRYLGAACEVELAHNGVAQPFSLLPETSAGHRNSAY